MYLVFVIGIDRTKPEIGCIVVAVLLHYLTLTTFAWMAVIAVVMYILIVKCERLPIPGLLRKASLCAWGKCVSSLLNQS